MAGVYPFKNYRIFFTPLIGENTYGDVVDVTQDVDVTDFVKSVGTIQREIDNGDYDIGIFTFGDITLNMINFSRKFNTPDDARSMFKFKRDRCKVEIIFYDQDATASTRFKGLINDDATRLDLNTSVIRFKVLSLDSILRQVQVPPGAIVDGDLFSLAIKKILNVPEITSTLTYSASNVVVDYDVAVDVGEPFSNRVAFDALTDLLLASNSILYVDSDDVVHVKARTGSDNVYYLYGHGDLYGRENIIKVKDYNNGLQRAFSSIKVGDTQVANDDDWITEYGFRQKSLSFDFITSTAKELAIAQNILDNFKVPKPEFQISVLTKDVPDIELLDHVSVDYNYRIAAAGGDQAPPMVGTAILGTAYLPYISGAFRIRPKTRWKVIGIDENPITFETTLKLRQTGIAHHDGEFTEIMDADGQFILDADGEAITGV